MSWTDERIERLRELWTKGMTASQIAEELGGVSRNAVIGKAHRLELQSRPSPVKANTPDTPKAEPRKVALPKQRPLPKPPAPELKPAAPKAPPPTGPVNASMPLPQRANTPPPGQTFRSVGPGGFIRQSPGEQAPPSTPAPPRRLVPAKPSVEISGKTSLLDLSEKVCKWPIGHPGEPDFHFCGLPVNPGFPYCVGHCGQAFQAQMPRRDRRPPPPMPFGGPRVR